LAKEIVIEVKKSETQVAIIEDGQLDDFFIQKDQFQSLLGNIYKGRVESILPSINAAFVNIGQERNGFLYLTDVIQPSPDQSADPDQPTFIDKILRKTRRPTRSRRNPVNLDDLPLKVGQEILVQVVKDPFGEKGARLTTHVTLPGRFVVYMPMDRQTGISRKIDSSEERNRLRDVMRSFTFAKDGGFIIRTASLKQSKRELIKDAKFLYKMWLRIVKKSEKVKAPMMVYEEGELTWKIVRDYLTDQVDRVIIDSDDEFVRIRKFVNTLIGRDMVRKLHLFRKSGSLFEAKNIAKDLENIYSTNVYCKTGAYIVIEATEGVIVVDVNSGKFKTKASPGEAAFMVNMEVIPIIARQLRLRDLGGIIVIDFIDMVKEEHKRKVYEALQEALTKDHAKTEVNRISSLGLVEMTRARTGKTVESISFCRCPYCDGRGRVKNF
jgi:ribonuclease G